MWGGCPGPCAQHSCSQAAQPCGKHSTTLQRSPRNTSSTRCLESSYQPAARIHCSRTHPLPATAPRAALSSSSSVGARSFTHARSPPLRTRRTGPTNSSIARLRTAVSAKAARRSRSPNCSTLTSSQRSWSPIVGLRAAGRPPARRFEAAAPELRNHLAPHQGTQRRRCSLRACRCSAATPRGGASCTSRLTRTTRACRWPPPMAYASSTSTRTACATRMTSAPSGGRPLAPTTATRHRHAWRWLAHLLPPRQQRASPTCHPPPQHLGDAVLHEPGSLRGCR